MISKRIFFPQPIIEKESCRLNRTIRNRPRGERPTPTVKKLIRHHKILRRKQQWKIFPGMMELVVHKNNIIIADKFIEQAIAEGKNNERGDDQKIFFVYR